MNPIPVPTPYQSPSYGGNPYLAPGTEGPAVPASSLPVYGPATPTGGTSFNTGQTYPNNSFTNYSPPTSSVLGTSTSANTGGGSSGGTTQDQRLSAWRAAGNTGDVPVGWNPPSSSGPDQSAIDQAITDTYNSSNSYLDQAQNQLQSDFPTIQSDINNQYGVDKGQLDTSHNASTAQFGQQQQQTDYAHESALAAARRLYSELRQGYQQRFGGSSSAGDAANQIANVEQQRQMGQQNQGYQQTNNQINMQKNNVDAQYQQGLQTLLTQRDASLNQANRDFQSKLLQISQNRAANEQAKGQAKLQALQDLRNQIFSINQQNTQFQQTLEAQRQQSALQLQNYQALAGTGVGAGYNAYNSYGNNSAIMNPTSNLQAGGYTTSQPLNLTGAIQQGGLKWDPTTQTFK